jgi:hypothetical protein
MTTDRDHMFDGDEELDQQESRIQELKRQAEDPSAGETLSVDLAATKPPPSAPPASPAAREQFWATVHPHQAAPSSTSEYEQLRKQGVALPPPEQLDDAGVARKVAEIVDAMSRRNVFLEHTDHLSDRALYEHLYRETLHEAKKDVSAGNGAFSSIDLAGAHDDDDNETFLRFYADDQTREQFKDYYPDGLPPRQPRPFDRDRHLPQPLDERPLIDDELPIDQRWLGDDTVS